MWFSSIHPLPSKNSIIVSTDSWVVYSIPAPPPQSYAWIKTFPELIYNPWHSPTPWPYKPDATNWSVYTWHTSLQVWQKKKKKSITYCSAIIGSLQFRTTKKKKPLQGLFLCPRLALQAFSVLWSPLLPPSHCLKEAKPFIFQTNTECTINGEI